MGASWGAPGAQEAVFGGPCDPLVGFRAILGLGGGSGDEISLEISSWALLEVPKVVEGLGGLSKSARDATFGFGKRAYARS